MMPPADNQPDTLAAAPQADQRLPLIGCWVLTALGAAVFLLGVSGAQAPRAWQALLINFVFWSGLAFGCVLFVAVLNLTNAHWARPLKRLAEAPAAFLPVAFVLFWVLYLGRVHLFPWLREPVAAKAWWLNAGFLFARDGLSLLVLIAVAVALVYHSVREDLRLILAQAGKSPAEQAAAAEPTAADPAASSGWRAQLVLSPIYAILYALVLSLVAIDLVMSLDPHWYSTLFGAYYFIGSFYTALAALMVLAIWSRQALGLGGFLQTHHFHDLGKLLLGFCLLTGDFFYSQFLVIWYGNLPEDTRYVILRIRFSPWEPLAWIVLGMAFVLPFAVLLSRKIKMKPLPMLVLSVVVLMGMWLERFLLVAPSLWKGQDMPLGLMEIAITAGFLGAMGACILMFLKRFPLLPVGDPLLRRGLDQRSS
jgi:hypothetical protein